MLIHSKIMKKSRFSCILVTTLFPICFSTDYSIAAELEGKKPLDNRELHQLQKFVHGNETVKKIRGMEVNVRVLISRLEIHGGYSDKLPVQKIPHQKVMCKVLEPDKGDWGECELRLISLRTGFFRNLEEGEEYQLEGMIMEDGYHDGHFTVYAHSLTKVKQGVASQPASALKLKPVGVRELLSRIEADTANVNSRKPVQEPLDKKELIQLRTEFDRQQKEGRDVQVKLRGTEVKVRVVITSLQFVRGYTAGHRPPCQPVSCRISLASKKPRQMCSAHLINLRKDFYAGLKEGEEYVLDGIIADDHYGFGNFWIYANSLTKITGQDGAGQPATAQESKLESHLIAHP